MTQQEMWKMIEDEALAFLGPRPEKVSPDIYYRAVTDLISHTLKLRSIVVEEPF